MSPSSRCRARWGVDPRPALGLSVPAPAAGGWGSSLHSTRSPRSQRGPCWSMNWERPEPECPRPQPWPGVGRRAPAPLTPHSPHLPGGTAPTSSQEGPWASLSNVCLPEVSAHPQKSGVRGQRSAFPVGSAFSAALPTQKPHSGQRSGEKPSQTHPADDSTWGPPLGPHRGRLAPGHRGAPVRTPRTLPPPGGRTLPG